MRLMTRVFKESFRVVRYYYVLRIIFCSHVFRTRALESFFDDTRTWSFSKKIFFLRHDQHENELRCYVNSSARTGSMVASIETGKKTENAMEVHVKEKVRIPRLA